MIFDTIMIFRGRRPHPPERPGPRWSRVATPLAMALALTGACTINIGTDDIAGSGDLETRIYDELDGFERIDVSSAFRADITVDPDATTLVEITADDNVFEKLDVDVRGDTLRIGTKSGTLRSLTKLEAVVVLPTLRSVDASGATDVSVRAAGTDVDQLEASGASNIRVTNLASDDLTINVSGASGVDISGTRISSADIDVSGASRVDVDQIEVTEATISVSGASKLEFGPASAVSGSASGASTVIVQSSTATDISTSGNSSVDRE